MRLIQSPIRLARAARPDEDPRDHRAEWWSAAAAMRRTRLARL